jgi:hypothetical protein
VHIQVIASPTETELISTTPAPAAVQPQAEPQATPPEQQPSTGT